LPVITGKKTHIGSGNRQTNKKFLKRLLFPAISGRPSLPFVNVFTVVIEREPVPVAVIPVAVLAVKGEIRPLPAESAGLVQGIFFFPEQAGEEGADPADDSHGRYVLP